MEKLNNDLYNQIRMQFKHQGWGRLLRAIFYLRDENDFPYWFSSLGKRYQDILIMRFGLKDGQTHTLDETAKKFYVTRERIRQMEAKALEIIRSNFLEKRKRRAKT